VLNFLFGEDNAFLPFPQKKSHFITQMELMPNIVALVDVIRRQNSTFA
jgi:hypothetical protein